MRPETATSVRALMPILAARLEAEIEERELGTAEGRALVSEFLTWFRQSAELRVAQAA